MDRIDVSIERERANNHRVLSQILLRDVRCIPSIRLYSIWDTRVTRSSYSHKLYLFQPFNRGWRVNARAMSRSRQPSCGPSYCYERSSASPYRVEFTYDTSDSSNVRFSFICIIIAQTTSFTFKTVGPRVMTLESK